MAELTAQDKADLGRSSPREPRYTRAQLAARLTPEKLERAAMEGRWADIRSCGINYDAMRQSLLDTLTGEGK
jgi:hypothetical protein